MSSALVLMRRLQRAPLFKSLQTGKNPACRMAGGATT